MAFNTSSDYRLNSQPEFKFPPLPSNKSAFRLVQLLPPEDEQFIRLRLLSCSLEPSLCPEYIALSYAWGEPGDRREVRVNGVPYLVQYNLWTFLCEMQRSGRLQEQLLFVDAICIDQENVTERNTQVAIMGRIYSLTREVFVWLGAAGDHSDKLMDYLCDITPPVEGHTAETMADRLRRKRAVWGFGGYGLEAEEVACEAFLGRSYWSRVWCVQEYLLPQRRLILCGERAVPSDRLTTILPWNSYLIDGDRLGRGSTYPFQIKDVPKDVPQNDVPQKDMPHLDPLYTLLANYGTYKCSDPRDKVYGILGLAKDGLDCSRSRRRDGAGIEVDYGKSALWLFFRVMAVVSQPPLPTSQDILRFGRVLRRELKLGQMTLMHPVSQNILDAASMELDEFRSSGVFEIRIQEEVQVRALTAKETELINSHKTSSCKARVLKTFKNQFPWDDPKDYEGLCWTYASAEECDSYYTVRGSRLLSFENSKDFGLIFRDSTKSERTADPATKTCIGLCFITRSRSGPLGWDLPETVNQQLLDWNNLPPGGLEVFETQIFKGGSRLVGSIHESEDVLRHSPILLSWLEMFILTTPDNNVLSY